MSITVNPILTQNALGSFVGQSQGYTQGLIVDDPVAIYRIAGGVLKTTQTLPVYAGMAISEFIPVGDDVQGSSVDIASPSNVANITGFTVFNSLHSAIVSQTSNVPIITGGMSVQFCRLGSNVRVPLAIDPALITLDGGLITQQVSWDFTNQQIIQYNAADAQIAITSLAWAAGVVTLVSASPHGRSVGDWVTISGAVPAAYNGDYKVVTVADTTHLTYALASDPGAETTPGVILAGGGLLAVKILKVAVGNSRVAVYNAATGAVNYNESGACALVLL